MKQKIRAVMKAIVGFWVEREDAAGALWWGLTVSSHRAFPIHNSYASHNIEWWYHAPCAETFFIYKNSGSAVETMWKWRYTSLMAFQRCKIRGIIKMRLMRLDYATHPCWPTRNLKAIMYLHNVMNVIFCYGDTIEYWASTTRFVHPGWSSYLLRRT